MAKIMVIDDEESVCQLIRKLFEPEGFIVITETDPMRGIAIVEKERPDCAILDIKMPNMDGIEVLSRIKALDVNIGVIMITGYGDMQTAIESMNFGAFDYVAKPFDLDFLKALVKACVERKRKGK